jgi:hypothetical protein
MDARRAIELAGKLAGKAAILMIVAVTAAIPASAAARQGVSLVRAEAAARQAVREHPSYRGIEDTHRGPATRRCWRASRGSVRCSLYVVVPSPCTLEDDPQGVCAQALWERRWLVSVKRNARGITARVLKITSGPSAGPAGP